MNRSLEKSVYELIYADLEEECSCLNPAERRKQIRESLYLTNFPAQNRINEPQGGQPDRTKTVPDQNTGELTAITAHTYLCMTAGNQQFTLDNHNTVLKQLILLVLAQRASIIAFQNVMSKISCGLEIHQQIMNNRKVSEPDEPAGTFCCLSESVDFVRSHTAERRVCYLSLFAEAALY